MVTSLVLVVCASLAQVEPVDPATLQTRVNRLVRQLDSNSLAERVAAEQALVELGPRALELLPAVTPRTSAEVKDRLGRVRTVLEKRAAEQAAEASLVTLEGEMTLAAALAALEKQTGNRVAGLRSDNEATQVKVDFKDAPFWQALDSLLDQANLTINTFGGTPGALTVMAAPEGQRPRSEGAAYQGVFRFDPLRIEAVRNLRNPDVQQMRLTLEVSWEPRVTPLSLEQSLDALTATSTEGSSLAIDNSRGSLTASTNADIASVELEIPFELPGRDVKEIASLQGSVTALIPGLTETYVFDNLQARGVENRKAGVTVVFDQMRKNQDLYEVRIRVRLDQANDALASHLAAWIFSNEAHLQDAAGKQIESVGREGYLQAANEAGVVYRFDLEEAPTGYKFVYKTPAAIVKTPVEYELKNIPLP